MMQVQERLTLARAVVVHGEAFGARFDGLQFHDGLLLGACGREAGGLLRVEIDLARYRPVVAWHRFR